MRHALDSFESLATRAREDYHNLISDLPAEIQAVAARHYHDRLGRSNSRLLLGECAPWLLADLLGITDLPAVRRLVAAWLHIYFFSLMMDDIIDRPERSIRAEDLITGSLLLQRGLTQLLEASSPVRLGPKIDGAFLETAQATIRELSQHRKRIRSLTSDPAQVGQKVALLKVCAHALMALPQVRSGLLTDSLVDNFATAIQLLDDITDWEEDLEIGRVSYPLALLSQRDKKVASSRRSSQDILLSLVETRALSDTIQVAILSLEKTLDSISHAEQPSHTSNARLYIEGLLQSSSQARDAIERIRLALVCDRSTASRTAAVAEINRALRLVAQGS